MTTPTKTWIWLVLFAIYLPSHSWSQPARVAPPRDLLPVNATSCIFAGKETRLSYVGATGPVAWTLSAANRTIRQGSAEPVAANPGDVVKLTIALRIPDLGPGVTLPAELQLSWRAEGREHQQIQPITLFSPDPFSVREAALAEAKITLFDAAGDTADVFERYKLPHSRVQSLSALDQLDEGIIVVGEGVSFRTQPHLLPALTRAAERGISVLCLAPSDGEFDFPAPDAAQPGPARIAFEQASVVRRYDKRFDLLPTLSHLTVAPRRARVVVEASESGPGWSWFAADFSPRQSAPSDAVPARLIVCGLSLIRDWEATPVPRYLLVNLLTELAATPAAEEQNHVEHSLH
jgi:hypothetical protein